MKNNLIKIFFILLAQVTMGQGANQGLIQSTQFPVNTYMINPAYAGAEDFTSFQAAYRRSYLGAAGINGPQTTYLSGHTRYQKDKKPDVKKEEIVDSLDKSSVNAPFARGRSNDKYKKRIQAREDSLKIRKMRAEMDYQKRYKEEKERLKFRPFHGFGGNVINESAAASVRTGLSVSYAYHVYLTKKLRWSAGASLGFSSYQLTRPTFRDADDPAAQNVEATVLNPDFNLGTFLYHSNFYTGISTNSLIRQKQFNNSNLDNATNTVILLTGGYMHRFNDDLMLSPSLWVRYAIGYPQALGLDFNTRLVYKFIWGGLTYRMLGGSAGLLGAMAGINIINSFDISIAYDYTLANYTNVYSGGALEIILGYRLQRKNNGYQSRLFN